MSCQVRYVIPFVLRRRGSPSAVWSSFSGTVKLSRICPFCGRILLDQRLRINDLAVATGGENAAKLLNLTVPCAQCRTPWRKTSMVPRLEISSCRRARNLRYVGPSASSANDSATSGCVSRRKAASWTRSTQNSRS